MADGHSERTREHHEGAVSDGFSKRSRCQQPEMSVARTTRDLCVGFHGRHRLQKESRPSLPTVWNSKTGHPPTAGAAQTRTREATQGARERRRFRKRSANPRAYRLDFA